MSHFNLKSLAFYGSAIAFVVALFSGVTAWGEANLKAQRKIDGRYPVQATGLPACFAQEPIVLLVQQSGVYLMGSMLPATADAKMIETAIERPSLTGKWENQQLQLTGDLSQIPACQAQGQATVSGTINQETLNGTLTLAGTNTAFSAQREVAQKASPSTH